MEERRLRLIAASGFSPIPTTSGASTISSRPWSTSLWGLRAASISAVRPTSWMRNVGGSSRSACTVPATSIRGASSPPIASNAMRITSVLDRHALLPTVVAAGGADPVRPLQVATPRARLERDVRRLIVRAAGALLPLGGSAFRYGHGVSVQSTRKITKTMELVATSKLKRAQHRVIATRPYAAALAEVIADLYAPELAERFPLLRQPKTTDPGGKPGGRVALILITANRGLCGAFNANLIREARRRIEQLEAGGAGVDLHLIGKKGITYFKFAKRPA